MLRAASPSLSTIWIACARTSARGNRARMCRSASSSCASIDTYGVRKLKRTVYVFRKGSHMTAAHETVRVSFMSRGTRCAGWLTLPDGPGPHPGLVLAHGLGATHGMLLSQYEQHFAGVGVATLAFDYRYTGESDGEPRQQFSMHAHRQDVEAACE